VVRTVKTNTTKLFFIFMKKYLIFLRKISVFQVESLKPIDFPAFPAGLLP